MGGATFLLELPFACVDGRQLELGDFLPLIVRFRKIVFMTNNIYNPTHALSTLGSHGGRGTLPLQHGRTYPWDPRVRGMEFSLRTSHRHPQRLRRRQLQRGGTQLEDDQEPGNKFVNDFIHDFGGKVLFMETFALCRWHALRRGNKRLQTFLPPARGVYQVSCLSTS